MTFGGWSIEKNLYDWIEKHLPKNKLILEFGSGESTQVLAQHWNVFSVEENSQWVGKYHENYIYAPIVNGYYDVAILKEKLPFKYDLLLIDGPAHGIRKKMIDHIELFNINTCGCNFFIFDDIERSDDYECYLGVLNYIKNIKEVLDTGVIQNQKSFGYVILKDS